MIQFKDGVEFYGLSKEANHIANVAKVIYKNHGQVLVVTSGMEGDHMDGSKHPEGDALDTRTFYFTGVEKRTVAKEMQEELGKDYNVVVEDDHIHTEYDLKL